MFEKFSETARRTLFFSRYEASRLGEEKISSEHLLLGLIREDARRLRPLFEEASLNTTRLREEIEAGRPSETRISSSAELPLTEDAKQILAGASLEAQTLNHALVGPEHLLLSILRLPGCAAAQALERHGLTSEMVDRFIQETAVSQPQVPSDTPIILSDEQCEFLDRIAAGIRSKSGNLASRQTLIQVILEAARSSEGFVEIDSFEELARRVSQGPRR